MKKILAIQVIDVLSKVAARSNSKKVDITSTAASTASFNAFIRMGTDIYGYPFASHIADEGIRSANQFAMLLMSDSFKDMLKADSVGVNVIKQIKYPTKTRVAEEMKAIRNKYKDMIFDSADDVVCDDYTYAIRTQHGNGPIVFVKGVPSDEGRHEVRRWYAWAHGINYFEVRECSFSHWANNPGTQVATARL